LDLARRIQATYSLEPAGSHGVWGLDDHQFLPYLFGSAQLLGGGTDITPADIGNPDTAHQLAPDHLFFAAVENIFKVKTGPFFEHSRYLYDMSGVAEWKKINSGLAKMFEAEVLFKFPVIQHFLFGSLLEIDLPELPIQQTSAGGTALGPPPGGMPMGVAPWARGGSAAQPGTTGAPLGIPMGVAPWAKPP
jgi:serine/threonine-protein phosphatase 2A activator